MIELPRLAICSMVKDEALYIEEWIAFHFLQGAKEILLFDNDSSDGTRDVLRLIQKHLPVYVVDWPGQHHNQLQMEAFLEGARRLSRRTEWVAFIDLDEFLFSARNLSLPIELAEFGPDVGAIAVGQRIFGSSGREAYEPALVTSRFTKCARPDHPTSRWFKTIARPDLVERIDTAHSVVLKSGSYLLADHTQLQRTDLAWHPGHADRVGHGSISLFHYMVKSREEYRWKQERFRGKNMESRYTDQYFNQHDVLGNEVESVELRRFNGPINEMIARWRGRTK